MKTKEQILEWLDKQPWKNEFYENHFKFSYGEICYDYDFIASAFLWQKTNHKIWLNRQREYRKWYNSNDKPMSWDEYCEQNPIQEDECYIIKDGYASPMVVTERYPEDVNVMSKKLCEAFVAYMKLIQLKNAWVKEDNACYRIIVEDNTILFTSAITNPSGLSFPTRVMAKEFLNTFKDLLEIAKPLL